MSIPTSSVACDGFRPDESAERKRERAFNGVGLPETNFHKIIDAIPGHRMAGWTGRVWLDQARGNEDPFVLGPSWAYSYCHATQLRRYSRGRETYVREGSCIIFCSGEIADSERVLAVDTLFWIAGAHRWKAPDQPRPDTRGTSRIARISGPGAFARSWRGLLGTRSLS